jgi:ABC-2 type transport system permease protein
MFPWNFFTGGVIQGLGSIRYQGDLVKKVYFPRQILPLVSVTVNLVNMIISFMIIYSIILVSGWGINWSLQPYLFIVIMVEYAFTLGLALALSAIEVYFRDIEHITSVVMMIWMYATPMFYGIDSIPDKFRAAFDMNPMLYIIGMYQQVLYYKVAPTSEYMARGAVAALVSFIVGWVVFALLEKRFAEEL